MAAKTILFLMGFFASCAASLYFPLVGVLAYMVHYSTGLERQWWVGAIRHWGIRYAFTLAAFAAVGMILNLKKLKYGKSLLMGQEKLLLLLLGLIWLLMLVCEPTLAKYQGYTHTSMKMTKVIIFVLMLTHVVTRARAVNMVLWVFVVSALALGIQAYTTPYEAFAKGRLEVVGGPDFKEANILAAYLACLLPLIGVQFLRAKWPGKLLCAVAGAFAVNGIILTRSRGAAVGIVIGAMLAVVLAPRKHRRKVLVGLAVAALGAYALMDPGFLHRTGTINRSGEQRDSAAQSRLEIWKASATMLRENPQGVGAGNFYQTIGLYNSTYDGRDAHNTFVRCYSELGIAGIAVFIVLILGAIRTLRDVAKRARNLPQPIQSRMLYASYGLMISLVTFLGCGLTMTLLYVEALWWLLALPVCLSRAMANVEEGVAAEEGIRVSAASPPRRSGPRRKRKTLAHA